MASDRSFARKIGSGVRSLVERKRLAAEAIRRGDLPLRGGLWFLGASFSVRAGTALEPPLDGVKRWFDFRPGPIMRLLVTAAGSVVLPWFAWRRQSGGGDASVLLISRTKDAIAFNLKSRVVVRHMDAPMAAKLADAVYRLRSSHTCPAMEYDARRRVLVEEFVAGAAFRTASPDGQLACVATIFEQLANAPRVDLPDDERQAWGDAFRRLLNLSEQPPRTTGHVLELVQSAAVCTVHGDLNGENIILHEGGHVVIDFDRVSTGPAFFDLVHLFMVESSWGRTHLLDALMRGEFDTELRALGVALHGMLGERRAALCCATIAWKLSRGILTEARALELMRRVPKPAEDVRAAEAASSGAPAVGREPVGFDGTSG